MNYDPQLLKPFTGRPRTAATPSIRMMLSPSIRTETREEETRRIAPRARLLDRDAQRAFVLAGDATFTVLNTRTGNRFTFRVEQPQWLVSEARRAGRVPGRWFVHVLTGPDNRTDYTYLGTLSGAEAPEYRPGRKSTIRPDAPSAAAFAWLWERLCGASLPDCVELWHEGRCGRCGRALTDPESIARGLGPVCVTR